MIYQVKGTFRIGEKYQPFNIKINAVNERMAQELTYTRMGSKHKCKRRFIKIEGVEEVGK